MFFYKVSATEHHIHLMVYDMFNADTGRRAFWILLEIALETMHIYRSIWISQSCIDDDAVPERQIAGSYTVLVLVVVVYICTV